MSASLVFVSPFFLAASAFTSRTRTPARAMRSGAHRARADERNAGTRLFIQSKVLLGRLSGSSGRLYVGGIKSVETSIQGVHAKMHDDDGHAPAGVVLRIYFQISISPLCENLPDAGK
jgi:hypothetical protein